MVPAQHNWKTAFSEQRDEAQNSPTAKQILQGTTEVPIGGAGMVVGGKQCISTAAMV